MMTFIGGVAFGQLIMFLVLVLMHANPRTEPAEVIRLVPRVL